MSQPIPPDQNLPALLAGNPFLLRGGGAHRTCAKTKTVECERCLFYKPNGGAPSGKKGLSPQEENRERLAVFDDLPKDIQRQMNDRTNGEWELISATAFDKLYRELSGRTRAESLKAIRKAMSGEEESPASYYEELLEPKKKPGKSKKKMTSELEEEKARSMYASLTRGPTGLYPAYEEELKHMPTVPLIRRVPRPASEEEEGSGLVGGCRGCMGYGLVGGCGCCGSALVGGGKYGRCVSRVPWPVERCVAYDVHERSPAQIRAANRLANLNEEYKQFRADALEAGEVPPTKKEFFASQKFFGEGLMGGGRYATCRDTRPVMGSKCVEYEYKNRSPAQEAAAFQLAKRNQLFKAAKKKAEREGHTLTRAEFFREIVPDAEKRYKTKAQRAREAMNKTEILELQQSFR